jgi:hypothetical protein
LALLFVLYMSNERLIIPVSEVKAVPADSH